MFLPINPSSGLPIYRQIMDQVQRMVVAGSLRPGDRVPSVRDLAAMLQVNHLTIGKAYHELEREGLLETRRGLGRFVAGRAVRRGPASEASRAAIKATAERLVLEAHQAGLVHDELRRLLDKCWQRMAGDRPQGGEP